MPDRLSINDLHPGQRARILSLEDLEPGIARRFLDLGLVRGEEIEFVSRAPLGDPVRIRLKGYQLAFRGEAARRIRVELCDPARP